MVTKNNNTKTFLWKALFLVVTIALGLVSTLWTMQSSKISDHEERLRQTEERTIRIDENIAAIKTDIAEIKIELKEREKNKW